jgi:hypothetical protein
MLPEQKVVALVYEPKTDTLKLETAPKLSLNGALTCQALLDSAGNLVGVDVEPHANERVVLMIGEHENVSAQSPVRAHCEGGVLMIEAAQIVRGHIPNPYWRGK